MKHKFKNQITRYVNKIKKMYDSEECTVGTIEGDNYIQMIPCVELLYTNSKGELETKILSSSSDLRNLEIIDKYGESIDIK